MKGPLTMENIEESIRSKVYTQDYTAKTIIEGVKILNIKNNVGEDGDFTEVVRLSDDGTVEEIPDFKIAQINSTKLLPGVIKAWHLHFNQDELFYLIPSGHLLVGLWDIRKDSPTKDAKMRIVLGGGQTKLLLVPRGVAHGLANISKKPAQLFYFVNQKFSIKDPDEKRIHWDELGSDFWTPQKD